MALSIGITGGIMLFTIFMAILLIPQTLEKTLDVTHTGNERTNIDDREIKTKFLIENIIAAERQDDVTFTITSTGTEKLWDFSKFDVFITYDRLNPTGMVTEKLDYDSSCPPQTSTWCINQHIDDYLEPNILNFDEGIEIDVKLDKKIANSGIVGVIVASDNGVISTRSTLAE